MPDTGQRLLSTTFELVRIDSPSGREGAITEWIHDRLSAVRGLRISRHDDSLVIDRNVVEGQPRLLLVGHTDTVPPADPPQPAARTDASVCGRGAVDMKGGVAVLVHLATTVLPQVDTAVRILLYGGEERGSYQSGLRRLIERNPEIVRADAAVVAEPTGGAIELGCQGNLRVRATYRGVPAHTARPWQGVNAVRRAGPAIARCLRRRWEAETVDGLRFPQALEVVEVHAPGPGNVLPTRCEVELNARYAPNRDRDEVLGEVAGLLDGHDGLEVTLDSPPALPAATVGALEPLLADPSVKRGPKLGWTEVGRLAAHGVPAVNFGPGDPELAHGPEEVVGLDDLLEVHDRLASLVAR